MKRMVVGTDWFVVDPVVVVLVVVLVLIIIIVDLIILSIDSPFIFAVGSIDLLIAIFATTIARVIVVVAEGV